MMAAMYREPARSVSLSEADDWILVWRTARLASGHALGWSSESIWSRLAEMRILIRMPKTGTANLPPDTDSDIRAAAVQSIVETMPSTIRGPFEAYNIGVIRGDSCRHIPHKARALILGLDRSVYYKRIDMARAHVAEKLAEILDRTDTFRENR